MTDQKLFCASCGLEWGTAQEAIDCCGPADQKHTALPLGVVLGPDYDPTIYTGERLDITLVAPDDTPIAIICRVGDDKRYEANTKLIETAVNSHYELLDALQRFVSSSPCQNDCDPSDMTCDTNFAQAAIEKAERGQG